MSRRGGSFLNNFGGKLSGEWMLAKAAQIAAEAPDVWRRCEKFIEGGDWLVWRLTGREVLSLDFAAYKAQYAASEGYPANAVEGLTTRVPLLATLSVRRLGHSRRNGAHTPEFAARRSSP